MSPPPAIAAPAEGGVVAAPPLPNLWPPVLVYTSLLIRKGWVVALSVPTWAPALAVNGLDNTFAWRAARVKPCSDNPERQPPHTTPGSTRQ